MAFVKVDLNVLSDAIRKLDSQISNIEKKQKQLLMVVESVENAWSGQDRNSFEKAAKAKLQSAEMKKILNGLKNQRQRLEDSRRLYQNAQNRAIALSRTLRC